MHSLPGRRGDGYYPHRARVRANAGGIPMSLNELGRTVLFALGCATAASMGACGASSTSLYGPASSGGSSGPGGSSGSGGSSGLGGSASGAQILVVTGSGSPGGSSGGAGKGG